MNCYIIGLSGYDPCSVLSDTDPKGMLLTANPTVRFPNPFRSAECRRALISDTTFQPQTASN
jgi:hypothetical protein